ncbi:hypothetical protein ASPTUDRAFT_920645 [Aspergillus tubingensis CBS 134.48]|uniref:Uncharacterized protein n=1 Tax=Aspergillus tubingensis (strain CBS 134.48) TaxID=767770 RepID=A0A1L9NFS4_ASPTC|nr:hypothetical protein ASPTUDRAFT_920645 [Aspergillus tubingensis CBS 134.48]
MDDPQAHNLKCPRQHNGICNPISLLGDTHDQPSHRPCRLPIDPASRPECNETDGEDDDPDYTPLADVAEMHESPVRERPSGTLDLTINSFFFPVLVVVANVSIHVIPGLWLD